MLPLLETCKILYGIMVLTHRLYSIDIKGYNGIFCSRIATYEIFYLAADKQDLDETKGCTVLKTTKYLSLIRLRLEPVAGHLTSF